MHLIWSVSVASAVRKFYLNIFSVLCPHLPVSIFLCVKQVLLFFCLVPALTIFYPCVTHMKIYNMIFNKTMNNHIKTTGENNLARYSIACIDSHSTQQAFLSLGIVALWCIVRVLSLTDLTAKSSWMIFKLLLPFGATPFCHSVISLYYSKSKTKSFHSFKLYAKVLFN